MKDKDIESESSESEIDENDPLAPQLHYIRMQKKLKKVGLLISKHFHALQTIIYLIYTNLGQPKDEPLGPVGS